MELKKGYKNTEIGVMPEDWEVGVHHKLANIVDSLHQTPFFSPSGFAMVRVTDIKSGNLILTNTLKVDRDTYMKFIKNYKPKKGDIVLSRVGSYGVSSFVDTTEQFCMGQNTVVIEPKIQNQFLYFILNSLIIQTQIEYQSYGTGYKSLSLKNIRELKIPLPPLPEQTAIANVLSDIDSLIQALEKKIAKKQLIKRGAMQRLLTPKEGWEVKTLGDFLNYEQPTKYIVESTKYHDNYDLPVLTAGKSFILGYTNESKGIFRDLPVIIFDDFTTASKYVDFPFKVKSSAMKILKPQSAIVDLRFVFEIMQQINFPLGDHKRHWIKEFQLLEITVPKSIEGQSHIAQILSDMDREIEILKTKLTKYKQLKQGSMQNLLTGKIRLV